MRDADCRGELVTRGHRGALSDGESLALRAHLDSCPSCRLDQQIFADFAEAGRVDTRDGARIERLALLARRWGQRKRRAVSGGRWWPWRLRAWAAAAVVLLLAGTASATAWWFRRHPSETASAMKRPVVVIGRTVANRMVSAPSAPPPAPATPLDDGAAATAQLAAFPLPAPARPRHALRASRETPGVSAATLLGQAGDARRQGEGDRALTLYRKLQRDFPDSPEALLSAVPFANLLYDRGFPRAALAELDRYLGSSRGGVLIPEALYGRARALKALGDRQEEQRTWEHLLSDFPQSSYAPLARRRLAELR